MNQKLCLPLEWAQVEHQMLCLTAQAVGLRPSTPYDLMWCNTVQYLPLVRFSSCHYKVRGTSQLLYFLAVASSFTVSCTCHLVSCGWKRFCHWRPPQGLSHAFEQNGRGSAYTKLWKTYSNIWKLHHSKDSAIQSVFWIVPDMFAKIIERKSWSLYRPTTVFYHEIQFWESAEAKTENTVCMISPIE